MSFAHICALNFHQIFCFVSVMCMSGNISIRKWRIKADKSKSSIDLKDAISHIHTVKSILAIFCVLVSTFFPHLEDYSFNFNYCSLCGAQIICVQRIVHAFIIGAEFFNRNFCDIESSSRAQKKSVSRSVTFSSVISIIIR